MRPLRVITAVLQAIDHEPATLQEITAALAAAPLEVKPSQVSSCMYDLKMKGYTRETTRKPWRRNAGKQPWVAEATEHGRLAAHKCRLYAAGIFTLATPTTSPATPSTVRPSLRRLPITLDGSLAQLMRQGLTAPDALLDAVRALSLGEVRLTRSRVALALARLTAVGTACDDGNRFHLTPVGRARCEELQQIAAAIFHLDRIAP